MKLKTPLREPNVKDASVQTTDVLQENGNYARFYWAKEESDKGWQFLSFVDLHDFTIIDEANLSDYVIEAVNSVKQLDPDDLAYVTDEVLNYLKKRNEVIFSYCFELNGNVRGGIIVYNENDMETPLRLKQTLKDELVHVSNSK